MTKQTFHTNRGIFSLDTDHHEKMAQGLAKGGVSQDEDISLLEKFINENSIVADIGANIGTFAIPLSRKAKEVLAFEPVAENLGWLKENILANNAKNITVFPVALGDENSEVKMFSHNENEYGNYAMIEGKGTEVKTLDSVVSRVDVMKIDVEGCEPVVLRGAERIIREYRPTILFEFSLTDLRRHNKKPFRALADALGAYDVYLPIEGGKRLCKVHSLPFVAFLEGPKAFVFGNKFLVINFLATTGTPPIPTVQRPFLYLLGRFMRKLGNRFFKERDSKD